MLGLYYTGEGVLNLAAYMQHSHKNFFLCVGKNFARKQMNFFLSLISYYMLEEVGHNIMSLVMWLIFIPQPHTDVDNTRWCKYDATWSTQFSWMLNFLCMKRPFYLCLDGTEWYENITVFCYFYSSKGHTKQKKKISRYPQTTELDWYSSWALQWSYMPGRAIQSLQLYFEQIG